MLFVRHPKILHKHCFQFLLGVKMAPRETENNADAKFWGDKQRALWYVMVFSGVVNSDYTRLWRILRYISIIDKVSLKLHKASSKIFCLDTVNFYYSPSDENANSPC